MTLYPILLLTVLVTLMNISSTKTSTSPLPYSAWDARLHHLLPAGSGQEQGTDWLD